MYFNLRSLSARHTHADRIDERFRHTGNPENSKFLKNKLTLEL